MWGEGLVRLQGEEGRSLGGRKGKEGWAQSSGRSQVTPTPVAMAWWRFPATCQDACAQRTQWVCLDEKMLPVLLRGFIVGHREEGLIGLCFSYYQVP